MMETLAFKELSNFVPVVSSYTHWKEKTSGMNWVNKPMKLF